MIKNNIFTAMEKLYIQTNELIIRNMSIKDVDSFFEYRSIPEVCLYQGFDPLSRLDCSDFIDKNKDKLFGTPGEWVQYSIQSKENERMIGDCAILLEKKDPRIAQIGVTLNPRFQGQGFAHKAISSVLDHLFTKANVRRVYVIIDVENIPSIKLFEKLKFRQEGHFIENIFFNGKWGSEYQYALLKSEFKKS